MHTNVYTYIRMHKCIHRLENNCKMNTHSQACTRTTKQMRSQHKFICSGDIIVFAAFTQEP